jgi:hypothetical protein
MLDGDAQVFRDAQARKDVRDLEGARQAAPVDGVRRRSGDRFAIEQDLAGAWQVVAGDEIEERRLAGSVRPY